MGLPGITDRFHLGMRLASFAMIALPDDLSLRHDDSTHVRIRTRQADTVLRLFERLVHPALVGDAVFFFSERRHRWINVEEEALSKSSVMRRKQTGMILYSP
jgi:hypothetical protein